MISKRRATSVAAIGAVALCILTASIGTDAPFIGGSVLGTIVLVCVARHIVKRQPSQDATSQIELSHGCTVVVTARPWTAIVDEEGEHRERAMIDVAERDSDRRVVRWLEDAPNYLRLLQGMLRDYDRLENAERENEGLRKAAGALAERLESSERDRGQLQQEVSQLKVMMEQYRQEIALTVAALVDGLDHLQGVSEQAPGSSRRGGP
jgi:hypothetical protein